MAHRLTPPQHPVEIEHDGERVVAERGEPIAHALIAADRLLLARSPKLHRPRGPYCLRGGCDGCLARVNGVPNVMTCQTPATGGERVETQNVLGSRGIDVLRATDFLFPSGIDHHRLFAGVRGLSEVVQKFARRVAGLGRLPAEGGSVAPAEQRDVDVLVVGGGRAGLGAAARLAGLSVLLTDDALAPGGSLAALDPSGAARLADAARAAGVEIRSRHTTAAVLREPEDPAGRLFALVAGPGGATLVRARAVILATGGHDPTLAFENDDLPGVMSARAALRLLRGGVAIGRRVAVVGTGRFAEALAADDALAIERVRPEALVRAVGRARVTGAVVSDGERERRLSLDALLVDGPLAPSFELAVQAGGSVQFEPDRGYVPVLDHAGVVAPAVWCAGSAAGHHPDGIADRVRAQLA